MLRWADVDTRHKLLMAVHVTMSTGELWDVRHCLDRGYLQRKLRCAGTRKDYQERLEESLRVDAEREEFPL